MPARAYRKGVEMKVVAFAGSPRIGGNTELVVREALGVIEEAGIETQLVRLADKDIQPCTD